MRLVHCSDMNRKALVLALVLAPTAVLAASENAGGPALDTPVVAPSPSPSSSSAPAPSSGQQRRARPDRPRAGTTPAVVDPYNHTQVQVGSVDTAAGTMTFVDVEGETSTWKFEPTGLAADPVLQPGARVTIVWKADAKGQPIQEILGVVAFNRPAAAPAPNSAGRRRPGMAPAPGLSPSASPSTSPSASPPTRP